MEMTRREFVKESLSALDAECSDGHGIEVLPERESMFAGVEYDAGESAVAGDVVPEPGNLFGISVYNIRY